MALTISRQTSSKNGKLTTTTLDISLASLPTVGQPIVVVAQIWGNGTSQDYVTGVADNQSGNVYTKVLESRGSKTGTALGWPSHYQFLLPKVVGATGTFTITITFTNTTTKNFWINPTVLEFAGYGTDGAAFDIAKIQAGDLNWQDIATGRVNSTTSAIAVAGAMLEDGADNAWSSTGGWTNQNNVPDGTTVDKPSSCDTQILTSSAVRNIFYTRSNSAMLEWAGGLVVYRDGPAAALVNGGPIAWTRA
jgi:hypothetical protein